MLSQSSKQTLASLQVDNNGEIPFISDKNTTSNKLGHGLHQAWQRTIFSALGFGRAVVYGTTGTQHECGDEH
jgi:hypothetical protein